MKSKIHVFVLFFCVFLGAQAYGQTSSPIDLVLLLDTSAGMSSSYDNVNNYISGPFLNEYLRVGDTFHLISFSSNPRLDAARRISGVGDVETIIGRMFLQYPVERGVNVGAAVTYAEQYIISLPNRPKKIVLITTGSQDTNNLVTSAKSRLSSKNATLDYVQVTPGQPLTNLPKSGRPAASSAYSSGTTTVRSPSAAGSASASTGSTAQTTQTQTETTKPKAGTGTGTSSTTSSSSGAGAGSSAASTSSTSGTSTTGTETSSATSSSASSTSTDSNKGTSTQSKSSSAEKKGSQSGSNWTANLPLIIGIILGILLLLALILFLSSRKLGSSPNRAIAASSHSRSASPDQASEERFADHSKDLNSFAASSARRSTPYENKKYAAAPVINSTGPLLLNLVVEDQNTAIGKRNIHSLKSGFSFSVGGGKADDFLIFLVPMPAGIGEIKRDGSTLTFTPKKAKYFPDIGSTPVRDCINKTIRIVSDKNYEMHFRFEMYEEPLIALNRVLMQVKVPG